MMVELLWCECAFEYVFEKHLRVVTWNRFLKSAGRWVELPSHGDENQNPYSHRYQVHPMKGGV